MELEEQVCSLELSKKLKELGVKQDSLWYWNGNKLNSSLILSDKFIKNNYSAFTVAELGKILLKFIQIKFHFYYLHDECKHTCFCMNIQNYDTILIKEKTEADTRAKIIICLLKKKLIVL